MKNLNDILEDGIKEALKIAFQRGDLQPEITQSTQAQFGDYQCNNALKLAKDLKLNPRQVAQKIIDALTQESSDAVDLFSKIEIAGPGFINFTFKPFFLSEQINQMLLDTHCGIDRPKRPKRVIVEFSSPNTAKELHVGHLRSTIIGDCLARVFEFLGETVIRLNHIGDWGTQFGMLIAYMRENVPEVLTGDKKTDLPSLMQWYKNSKKQFDEDPEFKKRAQLEVVKLQGGDEATLAAWKIICDISRKSYGEIYDLLDVKLTERGSLFIILI
jgi:arginyl-tRNA synthetase